jgi:hypothetical protein
MSRTVGFTSSNWTWGEDGRRTRCMGASFYYRGGLAASVFAAKGLGGWVAERGRSRKDGALEILCSDHVWRAPDVVWTEWIGATQDDVERTLRARATGQVVVGDMDDDVWSVPRTNDAHKMWDAVGRDRVMVTRTQGYFAQLQACDAIICSTEDLARKAQRRLKRPTYLIRNAIDCEFITPHDPAGLPVSWIGSTPWRANDLPILRTAGLGRWLRDRDQVLYHGGHMEPPRVSEMARATLGRDVAYRMPATLAEQAGLDPDQVVTRPNVPFARYPWLWENVGVSLIPLEDCPFNRAKSWLKGLESCAAGVPFIVSAGFPEYEALEDEGALFIEARSSHPGTWLAALDEFMNSDVRRRAGAINREVAERNDIRVRWLEWKAVLEDVAGFPLDDVLTRSGGAPSHDRGA